MASPPVARCRGRSHPLVEIGLPYGVQDHAPFWPCEPEQRHGVAVAASRSEEHTSELQSRQYLVCRLPLEKNPGSRRCESRLRLPGTVAHESPGVASRLSRVVLQDFFTLQPHEIDQIQSVVFFFFNGAATRRTRFSSLKAALPI